MKHRAILFALLSLSFTLTAAVKAQQAKPDSTTQPTPGSVPTVTASVALQGSLASKSSPKGAEVKAIFRRPATLPDGETLPKGTVLLGRVVEVLPHSKAKPNGAMLLLFEEAKKKDDLHTPVRQDTVSVRW